MDPAERVCNIFPAVHLSPICKTIIIDQAKVNGENTASTVVQPIVGSKDTAWIHAAAQDEVDLENVALPSASVGIVSTAEITTALPPLAEVAGETKPTHEKSDPMITIQQISDIIYLRYSHGPWSYYDPEHHTSIRTGIRMPNTTVNIDGISLHEADECGHILHPALPDEAKQAPKCPPCLLREHLRAFNAQKKAFADRGGIIASYIRGKGDYLNDEDVHYKRKGDKMHNSIRERARRYRLKIAQLVLACEGELTCEKRWAEKHPDIDTREWMSASKVLELYDQKQFCIASTPGVKMDEKTEEERMYKTLVPISVQDNSNCRRSIKRSSSDKLSISKGVCGRRTLPKSGPYIGMATAPLDDVPVKKDSGILKRADFEGWSKSANPSATGPNARLHARNVHWKPVVGVSPSHVYTPGSKSHTPSNSKITEIALKESSRRPRFLYQRKPSKYSTSCGSSQLYTADGMWKSPKGYEKIDTSGVVLSWYQWDGMRTQYLREEQEALWREVGVGLENSVQTIARIGLGLWFLKELWTWAWDI